MRHMNWKWTSVAVAAVLLACGGKSDSNGDGDGDTGASTNAGDGDGDSGSGSAGKSQSCADFCAIAEECDEGIEDCQTSCEENDSVSQAGQEAVSKCFTDVSCEPTEYDLLDAILCVTDELEDAELSKEQKTFCSTTSKAMQQCTDSEPDTTLGDCEAQIALVSDELLSDINDCDASDCDKFQECVGLQIFQEVDFGGLSEAGDSGEVSAGTLADLLALVVLGSQLGDLGQDTDPFFGAGGGSP